MIALVDYGAGNLTSVRKAFTFLGADLWTPLDANELARADAIVVPGVGHFDATRRLDAGWRAAVRAAIDAGKPVLGICVGLQWLFEGSTEAPGVQGLGAFAGQCSRLPEQSAERLANGESRVATRKIPHVGWNSLSIPHQSRLMASIASGTQVYFTHSYAAPVIDETSAICEYGMPFSAAVERVNVAAVQFHPEKSGDAGLQILRNWLSRTEDRGLRTEDRLRAE